jgi:hypothetical protein
MILNSSYLIVHRVRFLKREQLNVHTHSGSRSATGRAERGAAHEMPRWVKTFGVVAAIAVVGLAAFHLAGGGMGQMGHGNISAHVMSAEHGHDVP